MSALQGCEKIREGDKRKCEGKCVLSSVALQARTHTYENRDDAKIGGGGSSEMNVKSTFLFEPMVQTGNIDAEAAARQEQTKLQILSHITWLFFSFNKRRFVYKLSVV